MFVIYEVDEILGDLLVHEDFFCREDADVWINIFGDPRCVYKVKRLAIPQS